MVKYIFTFFLLITTGSLVRSQDNYDASLISSTMRARANAIVRNEETVVDMRSHDNVMYTVKKAVTVFNKSGDDHARLVLFYDKNTTIKSIKGEVYNEMGKLMGKFSQNDFKDESAVQDFSLFEDSRVKHYLPSTLNYPYTVVYNYEIRYKQSLIIPEWVPKPANDIAVEKSSYTFICKPTDQFRLKTQGLNTNAIEKSDKDQKSLTWTVRNLQGVKPEPYAPFKETYQTSVKIAPQQFTYFKYDGNYTNWQELGKWQYDYLLKNRRTLPPSTVQLIKDLIKDETSDKGKARKIYQYLQQKTRYISIQVGIGGFQPFTAADVDRLGYGDCKALVNYMQSLLDVANIESYYCVVESGSEKKNLDPSFASMNQGNHIILCMPLKGDTTWLECTSQRIPFGFLGDFTDDRYVLACTPEGGKLLRTPKLTTAQNLQQRVATLTIAPEGSISGAIKTKFSGSQYDNHEYVIGKPSSEQQKLLKKIYDIDNINFEKVNYDQQKGTDPMITEDLTLEIRNYATVNNDRLYFTLNAFNTQNNIIEVKNRTLPVYINRGFTDVDTIIYQLPANAVLMIEPFQKNLSNEFGSYTAKMTLEGKRLVYIRRFKMTDGTFPAESYPALVKFISEVHATDFIKVAFSLKK